jgi:hypothetical protein
MVENHVQEKRDSEGVALQPEMVYEEAQMPE